MMEKSGKSILIILSVMFLLVHDGAAAFRFRSGLGGGGVRNENYNRQYRSNYYQSSASVNGEGVQNEGPSQSEGGKPGVDQSKATRGLSAWGIIAIIVGIILLGAGGYYAFVFYPYVCRKERKYDMIELTNVL